MSSSKHNNVIIDWLVKQSYKFPALTWRVCAVNVILSSLGSLGFPWCSTTSGIVVVPAGTDSFVVRMETGCQVHNWTVLILLLEQLDVFLFSGCAKEASFQLNFKIRKILYRSVIYF